MLRQLLELPIDQLQAGSYQPRQDFNAEGLQELAQSLVSQGLIEPLIVRLIAADHYEIIAGERRWRAAQLAGLKTLPCLLGEYTDQQACALTLIENIQRQDLNLMEEALGYRRLIEEFNYRQNEIALLVGKSRSHIANILRLCTLSEGVKFLIRENILSLGHARVLVGLSPNQQEYFAQKVKEEQYSVRELEQAIKGLKNKESQSSLCFNQDKDVLRLQNILSEQLGAPVQITNDSDQSGWLKLKFFDNDTLAGLLERLGLSYD